jgi:hypothetical protein
MSLRAITDALGGDLYDGGRRANIPAPGHSRVDRSVSLLLTSGRVIAHSFGGADWREVLDDLRARGLIDAAGGLRSAWKTEGTAFPPPISDPMRTAVATRLWAEARPVSGTLSAVHARSRHVRRGLPDDDVLRHHPAAPLSVYAPGRRARPALLAAVRDALGGLTALEITYLAPNGRRALDVRLARKTVGVVPAGAAVRLDPPETAMLVGEGVFTTLSATERFGLPGWALLSTGNLRRWRAPDGVRRVLIAADRGREGQAAAHALAGDCEPADFRCVCARRRRPTATGTTWRGAWPPRRGSALPRLESRRKVGTGRAGIGRISLTGRRWRCPMTDTSTNLAVERTRRTVPLRDLGVAPENVRCREAADSDIPQLAATIKAAGVLMPLTVRPGRRKEKPFMALDGRRRLLALTLLAEAGDIDDTYLVEVVEETDPARQAAAALLTNTALPVNVADVIVSIGRMLKSKLTLPTVAAALGYGEMEVRRLAALAGLHATRSRPCAKGALRSGTRGCSPGCPMRRCSRRWDARRSPGMASRPGASQAPSAVPHPPLHPHG